MRKFIWEKWVDPMGVYATREKEEFIPEKEYFDNYSDDSDSDLDEDGVAVRTLPYPAIATNFGLLPINHYNNPAKVFDFWVCHTNFNVSEEVYKIIDVVPGVEALDLFSRYRFRISVAKAFDFHAVRLEIENKLRTGEKQEVKNESLVPEVSASLDPLVAENIAAKVDELSKGGAPHWILYVVPNGNFEVSLPPDAKAFRQRKEILQMTKELAGGVLLCSE